MSSYFSCLEVSRIGKDFKGRVVIFKRYFNVEEGMTLIPSILLGLTNGIQRDN